MAITVFKDKQGLWFRFATRDGGKEAMIQVSVVAAHGPIVSEVVRECAKEMLETQPSLCVSCQHQARPPGRRYCKSARLMSTVKWSCKSYKDMFKFFILIFWPFYIIRKYPPLPWVCWFSKRFWDIHDYPVEMGGDGCPQHFYTYTCHRCGKGFGI